MGVGITEHQTGSLGEDDGVGIALAGAAQVEGFGLEWHMHIFGHVVGIEHEAVVAVTALVEDFGMEEIERAEIGAYLLELYAPLDHGVAGRQCAGELQFAQRLHKACSGYEDLAARTVVEREGGAAEIDEVAFGESVDEELVFASGLSPDAAGEVYVLVLGAVEETGAAAEEEIFLHAQTHVDDGGLFLVGERPADFLIGDLGQTALPAF